MKKYLLYPFDEKAELLLKNKDRLRNMEIQAVASPKGWGRVGDMVGKDGEYEVSGDFVEALSGCDGAWFVNSESKLSFRNVILPKLLEAVKMRRHIFYTRDMTKEELAAFRYVVPEELRTERTELRLEDFLGKMEIYQINAPVVMVAGVTERTDKARILAELRQKFEDAGVKALAVGAQECSSMESIEPIPGFMFDDAAAERSKIVAFNHYIKYLERTEKPELLLIEIPGEVMSLTPWLVGNFGILAFDIAKAVPPDVTILSTCYEMFQDGDLERMIETVEGILDEKVDYCNIAPRMIDLQESEEVGKLKFITLDEDETYERTKQLRCGRACFLRKEQELERIVQSILEDLTGEAYEV